MTLYRKIEFFRFVTDKTSLWLIRRIGGGGEGPHRILVGFPGFSGLSGFSGFPRFSGFSGLTNELPN